MSRFENHTEGPWSAEGQIGRNHHCPNREKNGGECPHDLDNDGAWRIVGPPATDWVGDINGLFSRKVDAELAAAAPDLLAILCALLDRPGARSGPVGYLLDSVRSGNLLTYEQRELLHQLVDEHPVSNGTLRLYPVDEVSGLDEYVEAAQAALTVDQSAEPPPFDVEIVEGEDRTDGP